MKSIKTLLILFMILSITASIISYSDSILIISPTIIKTEGQKIFSNFIYSNPLWDNGTAIVQHNSTFEAVYGLGYSYAVQNVDLSNFTNFTYIARYDYFSGVNAGPIVLGGNVNLNEPANQQPYVLIYSVISGTILIKTPQTNLKVIISNLPVSVSGLLEIKFTNVNGNLTITTISLNGNNLTLIYITPIPWSSIKYVGWFQDYGFSYLYYLTSTPFLKVPLAVSNPMIAGETLLKPNIVSSPQWDLGSAQILNKTENYETLKGEGGDYIVEGYNFSSLNYIIVSANFTYYSGSNVGIELLGSNTSLTISDLSQSTYALLYAINSGLLWVRTPSVNWYTLKGGLPTASNGVVSLVFLNDNGNVSVYEIIIGKNTYFINISTPIPWSKIGYVGWRPDNGVSKLYFMPEDYIIGVQAHLTFEFLNSVGSTVPNQEYYIFIGDSLSNLQFYTSGHTNSSGIGSLVLPILYPLASNYEYVRIVWVNSSANVTLMIPLIKDTSYQLNVPLNTISITEEKISINLNYIEISLFIVLIIVLLWYIKDRHP